MSNVESNDSSHINAIFVLEGHAYSKEMLIEKLSMNEKNFDVKKATNLISRLIAQHLVTKSVVKPSDSSEDDYATDWEDLDYDDSSTWKNLSFSFVGLYYFNGILIKSIPKYFRTGITITNTNDLSIDKDIVLPKFKQVLKVIEKYKNKLSQKLPSFGDPLETNHLSLVISLIEDYYENGIYNNDQIIKEINGNGTIDWEYTVNNFYPFIKNNKPYYFEYQTVKRNQLEDNYFCRLHKAILSRCSKELKECDLIELMGFDELELSDEELICFGEDDVILYNLEKEQNSQFNTQKLETLRMLSAYINSDEKTIKTDADLKLFRVNKFDLVWEDVCRYAVGDDLNTKLDERIIKSLKGSHTEHLRNLEIGSTFKDVMECPKWFPEEKSDDYASSSPLILDSIKYSGGSLCIFDAKYYVPTITPKNSKTNEKYSISDMPGVSDITKQYIYQVAYKDFSDVTGIRISNNTFLLPKDEETKPNKFCKIKMDMFKNLDNSIKNIDVIQVSAKEMFDCYLKEEPYNPEYILIK